MSNTSKRKRDGVRPKMKSMGDHKEFLRRITKTLYYGELPSLPCLSMPVTEVSCAAWSAAQRGRSLRRLHADAAACIARSACVSPCALVLAVLYLERLHARSPHYVGDTPPADLFLVSLMVGNKFLQDDGEDDDVVCSEWAASGGIELSDLKKLELDFLKAIDWNVYVSQKAFEEGLSWLERQVALRQARRHGFFTYTDLAAACDGAAAGELVRGCLAATLGCLSGLAALLASALLLAHALPRLADRADLAAEPAPGLPRFRANVTVHLPSLDRGVPDDNGAADKLRCCTDWIKYHDRTTAKWHPPDTVVPHDRMGLEPWRSRTSLLTWLYHSSLVGPLQRWLERMEQYTSLARQWVEPGPRGCGGGLNLSKLGALVVSLADR